MVIIAAFCGILSILISGIAVYQSEHFNKLSRDLNKDTKLMIDCNEKSISSLHVTLNEIINKEEEPMVSYQEDLEFIRNELLIIKMYNYDSDNKFNILHSIMKINSIVEQKSISDLEIWLDDNNPQLTLMTTKEISKEDYKIIDIILEEIKEYGVWFSFNIDLYRDVKKTIKEIL